MNPHEWIVLREWLSRPRYNVWHVVLAAFVSAVITDGTLRWLHTLPALAGF